MSERKSRQMSVRIIFGILGREDHRANERRYVRLLLLRLEQHSNTLRHATKHTQERNSNEKQVKASKEKEKRKDREREGSVEKIGKRKRRRKVKKSFLFLDFILPPPPPSSSCSRLTSSSSSPASRPFSEAAHKRVKIQSHFFLLLYL